MSQKPRADAGMKCPMWRKDMSKVCHTCEFYQKIVGHSPIARFPRDEGEWIDKWGCTLSHAHLFQAQAAAGTAMQTKEINELRNEIGTSNRTQAALAAEMVQAVRALAGSTNLLGRFTQMMRVTADSAPGMHLIEDGTDGSVKN